MSKHTTFQIPLFPKYAFVLLAIIALADCHNSNSLAIQGLKFLDQGKKITALKYFEEALDANKKNPLALYGKGKIMIESSLTMSLGQKLIESSLPKLDKKYKTDAVLSLGKSYAATNLYGRAIKVLEESLAEGNQDVDLYLDLSFYHLQNLEKNPARNILVKGLAANPKSMRLYLAQANLDQKYFHDNYGAIQTLEKAFQMDKTSKEAAKSLAVLYYKIGNPPKAVDYLKILKDLQTDNAEKLNTEKWILQAQSRQWQINP